MRWENFPHGKWATRELELPEEDSNKLTLFDRFDLADWRELEISRCLGSISWAVSAVAMSLLCWTYGSRADPDDSLGILEQG